MIWKNQSDNDEAFFYLEHNRDERKRAAKRRHRLTQSRRRLRR